MLTVAIQAGGSSSRMGQDKALLPFLGKTLLQHVVHRLAPLADEILVTTNQPDQHALHGIRVVTDLLPGRGALGGLYTALACASHPLVAVVACDMPFASPDILRRLCEVLTAESADAAIPSSADGLEPLHAVYNRSACLPPVEAALQAGQWKIISWHEHARIRILTAEETAPLDPHNLAFWNLNTPGEFRLAEQKAREIRVFL